MNKGVWVLIAVVIIVIISIAGTFFSENSNSGSGTGISTGTSEPVLITFDSLPAQIQKEGFYDELPKSSRLIVYFGDKAYSVEGQEIIEGTIEDPDIIISVPESYLDKEWYNLCELTRTASNNGELSSELLKSELSLAWKYKALYKYKSCLGL